MRKPVLFGQDEHGEFERELPCRWAICCSCDGHGTDRGRSVECDGGGFTSSEWAEQDHDFRQDYLAGVYDRPCEECRGSGKVQVADYDAMSPADVAAYESQLRAGSEYQAMCAAERRMGA